MLHHGYATKSQVLGLERIQRGRFSIPTSHLKDRWREVQSLANFSADVKKKPRRQHNQGDVVLLQVCFVIINKLITSNQPLPTY